MLHVEIATRTQHLVCRILLCAWCMVWG